MNFLNAGIPVVMLEMKQGARQGRGDDPQELRRPGQRRQAQAGQVERAWRCSRPRSDDDLKDADMVIEAVFEDIAVRKVFKQLDAVMKPGAILAEHLDAGREQDRGLHRAAAGRDRHPLLQPGQRDEAAGVVRGEKTAKDVLATGDGAGQEDPQDLRRLRRVRRLHRQPHDRRYSRQAGFLLEEAARPSRWTRRSEVRLRDGAVPHGRPGRQRHPLVHPQAPLRRKVDLRYSKTADLLCEMGRHGQKTGAGWYDRARQARRDPEHRSST